MIPATREQLLSACFADCPQTLGGLRLRPLSAKSFTLLGELGNPMVGEPLPGAPPMSTLDAVIQYLWIHSADLDTVAAIQSPADLPQQEIRKLGFQIELPAAFEFLRHYQASAARMSAALAHIAPEDEEDTPGKPAALPSPPAPPGSPPSSSPSAAPEIPPASVTSSGSCPSSGPSPISTLPTSPPEPIASGLVPLPELPPSHPLSQMPPPPSAPSSSATPSASSP